ncbi:cytochrome c biogenesis transmembrane protein [Hyphomicrobium denitrificans 1NES1]|uniref:Cytochrome c biogenesis transmembrane protein n=1 Tax=Hyphomicrobium denitrificans 1NES1 TaxID=670307 RepID=N0B0L5_9HYPH|nr:cytochrome c biogenesis protein CcdA [Hyphomicrobium denitrificans]AGK56974.1 cytochrome c biogenesis transmembrane protein [Hyphomicrobium denitrificans 1NES1]
MLLAIIAGLLSSLSPCVLPLLPIVFGSAFSEHRYGPAALAAGLAISFTTIGMFVATVGFSLGLTEGLFRMLAAALLAIFGMVLIVPRLHVGFSVLASPISAWTESRFGGIDSSGLGGQFLLGLLLGAVWSPCIGPTLGAASVLASQGKNFTEVALTMGAFGLGAALPLLAVGILSREKLASMRGRLANAGTNGKLVLGGLLLVSASLVLTGLDKVVETKLLELSPTWLTQITTSV